MTPHILHPFKLLNLIMICGFGHAIAAEVDGKYYIYGLQSEIVLQNPRAEAIVCDVSYANQLDTNRGVLLGPTGRISYSQTLTANETVRVKINFPIAHFEYRCRKAPSFGPTKRNRTEQSTRPVDQIDNSGSTGGESFNSGRVDGPNAPQPTFQLPSPAADPPASNTPQRFTAPSSVDLNERIRNREAAERKSAEEQRRATESYRQEINRINSISSQIDANLANQRKRWAEEERSSKQLHEQRRQRQEIEELLLRNKAENDSISNPWNN